MVEAWISSRRGPLRVGAGLGVALVLVAAPAVAEPVGPGSAASEVPYSDLAAPPAEAATSGTEASSPDTPAPNTAGLMLDIGFPDGATLSAAWRPIPQLRLFGGGGTNTASLGLRGGVTALPFGMGPSLTVAVGHYFEGDASMIADTLAPGAGEMPEAVRGFGYDFVTAQAGLELGGDDFSFYLHGGVSWMSAVLHDTEEFFEPTDPDAITLTTVTIRQEPTLSAMVPSLAIGFIAYLY